MADWKITAEATEAYEGTWNWSVDVLGHTFACTWSPTLEFNQDKIRAVPKGPSGITWVEINFENRDSDWCGHLSGPSGFFVGKNHPLLSAWQSAGLVRLDAEGFIRPSQAVIDALADSRPDWKKAKIAADPIANAQAATELAAKKARERGINKDTWLPYVRAALTFWARIQGRALADDNMRASFQAMGQQLKFSEEFSKLTGREFDLVADEIFYRDIEAI